MNDLWRVVTEYPLSPLVPVALLWATAVVSHAMRRRRWAAGLALAGAILLWVACLPATAMTLERALAARVPPQPARQAPGADAIVLLGGALAKPRYRGGPFLVTESTDRVHHAAALYRAGKAPLILVSAGPEPPESPFPAEAHAIAALLVAAGVPREAIRLETRSKSTRENATFSRPYIQQMGATRILLVTSSRHMSRAWRTFERALAGESVQVLPAPAPVPPFIGTDGQALWLPTGSGLLDVTKCLKEFAGLALLDIM